MITVHLLGLAAVVLAAIPIVGAIGLFLGAAILLTGIFFHFAPEMTRHDLFFAVTVDQGYFRRSEEARRILRQFQTAAWIHTAVALAIVFVGAATKHVFVPLIGIVWQIAGMTIAFLRARKQVLPHAVAQTSQREAALAQRETGIAYWILQLGPFAVLAAYAVYLQRNWQRIPERFPVHWGINGEPNGWSTRSLGGVYGMLLIGLLACVLVGLFSYGAVHWTRQNPFDGNGCCCGDASASSTSGSDDRCGVLPCVDLWGWIAHAATFEPWASAEYRPFPDWDSLVRCCHVCGVDSHWARRGEPNGGRQRFGHSGR